MTIRLLPFFIIVMGVFYIFFAPHEPLFISILFKIIPMLSIILYAFLRAKSTANIQRFDWVMMTGIAVCTIADAAIAITFIAGLVIFLLGHIVYIIGFSTKVKWDSKRFLIIIPLLVSGFIYGQHLTKHISEQESWLIGPVLAYIVVISIMVLMAFMTGNIYAMVGSLLFYLSDSILAWNMFIESLTFSKLYIMSTYYAGQLFIAHSIMLIGMRKNTSS